MAFNKKGSKVAKVTLAAAMATSVIAVTNPAEAASQKEAEKLVKKAEQLASKLQKEINYESRVKLYPKNKLGLPNMKLYKDTGAALQKAKKEVNKLKGTSKKKLQTRLTAKVENPYKDATTYIKVANTAKGLDKTTKTLNRYLTEGKLYTSVIKIHTKYTEDVKDFNKSISKVRGTKTKQALRDTYVKKFNQTNKSANYAITIKKELDQLNALIKSGDVSQANALQKIIQNRIAYAKKMGYMTTALSTSFSASLEKAKQGMNNPYTYTAESSDVAKPTVYGGTASEKQVINHDLVIEAGKDRYIKVTNVEVNGNIVIKGNETGAGTVIFDHVNVNAVNGTGGEIIVQDVAEHSFYISNVKADKLSIKDINGGNIVAQEGTKIKDLVVVDKAGETGQINIVSEKGSFNQVSVASTGEKTDVAFNGDFSESKIEVKAPAAQVMIAKDAVIKAMEIKSEAKINAQEGSKVETINLAVEQKGDKVEFSGALKNTKVTISNANVTVEIAKDTVIKEIEKAKDVKEDVKVNNNGKVDKATGVDVGTKPSSGSSGSSGGGSSSSGSSGSGSLGSSGNNSSFTLSLMHTNDTHARLDNIAKKVTAVKEVRAAKPQALLIDAGDVFSGTIFFNEFKGKADLQFMNLMKYDLMTFGNHEFDLGSDAEGHQALADFIKEAQFSFVSTNVDFSKDEKFTGLFSDTISSEPSKGKIYNGIVKEINGEKVGFFGLTTQETKDLSSPGKVEFTNYLEEAEKAVKAFEGMGVNKIVAISHIGYDDTAAVDNDLELASKVDGIDIIVGGHSHTQLDQPKVVTKDEAGKEKDPTVIVQAYQYNDYLGTVDVQFDKNGDVIGQAGQLIKIADKEADAEALKLLEPYKSKVEEVNKKDTGATAVNALGNPRTNGDNTKPSVRKNETALGNVITDGMLAKAKTYNSEVIMALQNGGGIRSTIDQGPITVGEVITVLPFGNTLATIKLTGAELKEAFETSLAKLPAENGGFLHVSGAKVQYDSSKPAGQRVVSIAYKNTDGTYTDIQAEQTYTIATNAFTAKGGDGYTVFAKAYEEGRVTDLGLSDWENFTDHLKSLGTVDPKVEGRIVDMAGTNASQNVLAADFSGTLDTPKTHEGNISVDITNISKLENAVITGNLTLTGTAAANLSLSNIKVKGNLDISGIQGSTIDLSGVEVTGDTTL